MFIDVEKTEDVFYEYTKNYDTLNPNIQLKISHSQRVMDISQKIAEALNLPEEDIEIAELIGLLHDIGRFKQITIYNTFDDYISIDHGDLAVEILDRDMRNYVETDKYDDLVKLAIKNHNKYKIEEGISDRELLFCKLIKDADKLDILDLATYDFWENEEELINNTDISPYIYEKFFEQILIPRNMDVEYNVTDSLLNTLSYVFDIHFKETYKMLKEKDYVNKILDRFNYKDPEIFLKIRNTLNEFIDKKIEEA